MRRPVIAVIGAGSANFVLPLVKDLCLSRRLAGARVRLMDIDAGRLEAASGLARRFVAELGGGPELEATGSRARALRGADFVIHTALAAGASHAQLRAGWRVARRLGYRFGGSLRVMHDEAFWVNFHQLRLMDSVGADMGRLCPRAWLLLVANPVFAGVTHLGRAFPGLNVVGLCHGFGGVYALAGRVGVDAARMRFEVSGVNHFIWLTRWREGKRNAHAKLDRWIRTRARAYWRSTACPPCDEAGPKKVDLYRRFGVYPVGDNGNPGGGAWPSWYHASRGVERRWKEDVPAWWRGHFRFCDGQIASIRRAIRNVRRPLTATYGRRPSGEVMVPLIEALSGFGRRRLVVNVPNRGGLVAGVPPDVAVEGLADCDRGGIRPLRPAPLPPAVRAWLLRDFVAPVNAELDAYATRSREKLAGLVAMDPWTRSERQARRLVDGIVSLPGQRALRRHYR